MGYQSESFALNAGSLGPIEGVTMKSNGKSALHYFGGLPYALPPTGKYRFRAPRKLPSVFKYGTEAKPGSFTGGTKICPQPPCRTPPDSSLFDEDCLQLNIWVPAGEAPKGGWPVLFYLHGGFLQWGTANWEPTGLVPLLGETAFKTIMVLPSFRLNAFGFLTGGELAAEAERAGETIGNMGLWDQRIALEWTHANIAAFGGNPSNIAVGGYSAGGFSSFQQLAHELYYVRASESIIKRVAMLSNSPGVAPKKLGEHQSQFDEYLTRLGISRELSAEKKLESLRALPFEDLIRVQSQMKISEFRILSDGAFYPPDLLSHVNSGDFARRMKERNIRLLTGECRDEHTIYRNWRPPVENSYSSVYERFCAEYPARVARKIMDHYVGPTESLPSAFENWHAFFGHVYANVQVHHIARGFQNSLFKGGLVPGVDVLRYRFDRRLQCVARTIPVEWGVSHSTDLPIWFWGSAFLPDGLTDEEKVLLEGWNEMFAAFVRGDDEVRWGPKTAKEMRRWRADGETDVWEDDRWDAGLAAWDAINGS